MALSKVPLKLGTRRRLVFPLLLLATTLALVAVTVLWHFNSSSTDLGSTAAYIAGLVRIGTSHPDNDGDGDGDSEGERGIGPADSSSPNWQRGTDGDRVQLENGTTVTYRNPLCVSHRHLEGEATDLHSVSPSSQWRDVRRRSVLVRSEGSAVHETALGTMGLGDGSHPRR